MPLILLLALGVARADGTVEGVVLDGTDGAPRPDAVVTVPDAGVTGPVAADGTFSLALPAGTWTVLVQADGRSVPVGAVEVVDDRTTELLVSLTGADPVVSTETPAGGVVEETVVAAIAVGGRVVDEAGRPIVGARLYARGQAAEAVTGDDGGFTLDLPPGAHDVSVIRSGFATRTVQVVASDGVAPVTIEMVEAGASLAAFTVTAPRIEGSTAGLLEERREASSVSETIGSEQMSKAGDSDAAAALRRVTGITVVGGRYVYVRGLGDRYSATLLNGSSLPSPEPEKRVVPLDLFPTSVIESVVIQKTFSPDRPAEFGGGVVQIRTKSVPTERMLKVSATGGYVAGTTFHEGLIGYRSGTDWLGFGAGPRALPSAVTELASDQPIKPGGLFSDGGFDDAQLERLGESFDSDRWALGTRQLPPNASFQISYGDAVDIDGGPRIGALVGLNQGNEWGLSDAVRNVYSATGDEIVLKRRTDYHQLTNRVSLGGIATVGAEWSEHNRVAGTVLLNRLSEYEALTWDADDPTGSSDSRSNRLGWVEQQLLFQQLTGHHRISEGSGLTVDWRYAYSEARRDEPDRREWTYTQTDDGYFLSQKGSWNEILYSALKDTTHDLGLDLSLAIARKAERPGEIKIGALAVERRRESGTRRFSYDFSGIDGIDLSAPIAEVLTDAHIGAEGPDDGGYLTIGEVTANSDDYTAIQHMRAAYAMAELPIGARLRVMGGARLEQSEQIVETLELFNPAQQPIRANLKTTDVLPAATATLAIGPKDERDRMLIRAGYGRTVSRPEFREMSEVPFTDFTSGTLIYGEPNLSRARIDNVDLRWELYPSSSETLSVAGFYKRFDDPIEAITEVSAVSGLAQTFANAGSATNLGVEVDARLSFGRIVDGLEDLYIAGNGALIRSRVDVSESGGNDTSDERPLQGQSPWVANLQLGYDNPETGVAVTLLYNAFGPRIVDVGQSGIPDTYEMPVHRVDAVALIPMSDDWRLRLKGSNLLDWPVVERTGAEIAEQQRDGWGASVQLQWKPL